ncbi:CoA transferase, partial [Arthrobacter sp.]|uniref:CoA transferase n=1 Tax=Arthrobacter sp. TaxID=1667 RepID=UPI0034E89576
MCAPRSGGCGSAGHASSVAGRGRYLHSRLPPDALDKFGLSEAVLRRDYPWLIDIGLDAYGWGGPWANRRGFDSLVQMSCGIAEAGREHFGGEKPFPLPVQALDHATG